MTTQQFIEKAIEGGWKDLGLSFGDKKDLRIYFDPVMALVEVSFKDEREVTFKRSISGLFLDPLAWQAVGKVEGWDVFIDPQDEETEYEDTGFIEVKFNGDPEHEILTTTTGRWQYKMLEMITALAEGKSLEDYIATL